MVFLTQLLKVAFPPSSKYALYGKKGIKTVTRVTHWDKKNKAKLFPNVQRKAYYSKILNTTLQIRMTTHTMRLIDKKGGFDSYIYHSSSRELGSILGVYLQNEMKKVVKEKNLPEPFKAHRVQRPPKTIVDELKKKGLL